MALTTESTPKLRRYTLRNEGGPLLDILDPDGRLRVTIYADLLEGWAPRFDPASIPAAEALTRRILDLLNRDLAAPTFVPVASPTPLLDIARLDAGRRFTLAERNAALAELRTLRQMIEPAALRPGFVFHGSTFNPDIGIEWGLPCDGGWREPTLYHSTIRDALVHEINLIDRLRRAQQGDQ